MSSRRTAKTRWGHPTPSRIGEKQSASSIPAKHCATVKERLQSNNTDDVGLPILKVDIDSLERVRVLSNADCAISILALAGVDY